MPPIYWTARYAAILQDDWLLYSGGSAIVTETTIAELIELLQNESASIDMQFQLWLAITSAVVIASFTGRHHLSTWVKVFVAVLYALASTTILLRYANDASQFVFLKNELRSRGVEYPAVVDLRILRALVYACGTVATLVFILFKPGSKADNASSSMSLEQTGRE